MGAAHLGALDVHQTPLVNMSQFFDGVDQYTRNDEEATAQK